LTLASIFIGVDVHQQDLDDLKAISKKLKQQLDTIDVDIARAKQVIAIGIAALALVKSLIPAIDPAALAAAVRQAGAALKPVKAPGSTG
jgi:thiamine monophosphate synthase